MLVVVAAAIVSSAACGHPNDDSGDSPLPPLVTSQPGVATEVAPTSPPASPTPVAQLPTASLPATSRATAGAPATTAPAATKKPPAPLDASAIAAVNGVAIPRVAYDKQLSQAQAQLLKQPSLDIKSAAGQQAVKQLQDQVLNWMIDQLIIEQAAKEQGISAPTDKVDAEITRMKGKDQARFDAWLVANGLTVEALAQQVRMDIITAAIRDQVTSQLSRRMQQVHARHILTSDEGTARNAVAVLRKGQNFITVARQVSEDGATRSSGGDLGFLPKGVMPPAFEKAAFALKPGEISDVVRSEFGFHIIQIVEVDPDREVPSELWPMVQQRAFDDWLAQERAKATIQLAAGPQG